MNSSFPFLHRRYAVLVPGNALLLLYCATTTAAIAAAEPADVVASDVRVSDVSAFSFRYVIIKCVNHQTRCCGQEL
jgi:hypothetical protein